MAWHGTNLNHSNNEMLFRSDKNVLSGNVSFTVFSFFKCQRPFATKLKIEIYKLFFKKYLINISESLVFHWLDKQNCYRGNKTTDTKLNHCQYAWPAYAPNHHLFQVLQHVSNQNYLWCCCILGLCYRFPKNCIASPVCISLSIL